MTVDILIVIAYFAAVFFVALRTKDSGDISSEEFFVCSRSLRWPSIAISSIATNIQGYQFLGMMGSAYIYGLAQANLEINAVDGNWKGKIWLWCRIGRNTAANSTKNTTLCRYGNACFYLFWLSTYRRM
ncbi:sodium transporter [Candidatus Uabimicrobium amorphum]|uniref:Sodium transporter n=1 Tax=Uabimicrobium amorphum TaxID=2596890 RepID=A0A5S9F5X9_UABAM|nr:hypothetical protein [Candidatus Uabimicrobium amorphum]BBM86791.1 sodium transporter [Candidatus Uabimicrobium amorphum]